MLTERLSSGQYRIAVEKLEKPPVERRLTEDFFPAFCKEHPYESVKWTKRDVKLSDQHGKTIFEAHNVEFPDFWSDVACQIVASKYFLRNEDGTQKETSLKQMVDRVCNTIASWGDSQGYFADNNTVLKFNHALKYLIIHQIASFNSPVWFNVGVHGLSPAQCSACFINGVEDNMESILDLAKTQGMIYKNGSGTGTNFSTLRSSKEQTSGGGVASGPLSFLKGYDAFAGVIRSGGILRRAASINILNCDHPDIFEFINSKISEEKKAKVLMAAGYSGEIGGEAYSSVFYQNANNSVRVTDAFMEACEKDLEWDLKEVTTGKTHKTVKARSILRAMAQSAWECGDPGIQYHDTINKAWPVKDGSIINASNPCSEVHLPDDSACNLASINLIKSGKNGYELPKIVKVLVVAQDILIDNSTYPTAKIAENSHKYRPLGLGYTNLGAKAMLMGLSYSHVEARMMANQYTKYINDLAWEVSNELGSLFTGNKLIEGKDYSRYYSDTSRNAQATVLAPTGTISFMMDAATTGIEPEIALIKYKSMVGGGQIKTVNPIVVKALETLNYKPEEIKEIEDKLLATGSLSGSCLKPEHEDIFLTALPDPVTGKSIPYQAHIEMMAAVQPYISGAISKTVNLPESATVEEIEKIYIDGWKKGLKCIAVYRNHSKGQQPINTDKKTENAEKPLKPEKLTQNREVAEKQVSTRTRLPETRNALNHKFTLDGHDCYITVGLYDDGTPGELFVRMSKEGSTISGLLDGFATMVSIALQHGAPLEGIIEKLRHTKFEPAGFTGAKRIKTGSSIYDYIAHWLEEEFIKKPEKAEKKERNSGNFCPTCGAEMVASGTCGVCPKCGTTGGCS